MEGGRKIRLAAAVEFGSLPPPALDVKMSLSKMSEKHAGLKTLFEIPAKKKELGLDILYEQDNCKSFILHQERKAGAYSNSIPVSIFYAPRVYQEINEGLRCRDRKVVLPDEGGESLTVNILPPFKER